ncbi:MAG: DUF3810 domain-containing protein [Oscillospiraceae bacterium]|nr:DUF3810 domain-containing protein [Oscillospiraceae bacterium]MBR7056048.1 DUF3810 domain-containing protein [Oscillospiraceae bacterium]
MKRFFQKLHHFFAALWRAAPVRHVLLLIGLALLGVYLLLRRHPAAMATLSRGFVRPWHRLMSRLTAPLPFSLGEWLIAAGVLALLVYALWTVAGIIRQGDRALRLYRFVLSCLTALVLVYAGFSYFWGVYYDCSDFEDQSGIRGRAVSAGELETVTRYFTDRVNALAPLVRRDAEGRCREELWTIFDHSRVLYHAVEQTVPCLAGDEVPAKPFFFSRILSRLNFSGFFFPFTAEANINTDCPTALTAATVAHELAHQRGVAQEDEANFVAVLACLSDGDPVFCYSACLLAYIHLGNALYEADYDAWLDNYARLSAPVRADLAENNAYWQQFKSPVSQVSDAVYTGFLHSYGQTLGLKTYGKCVDLLVAYYYDEAARGN